VRRELDGATPRPDGYKVGFNAGEAAGQTVMHLRMHVIPRYRGDVPDPRGGVRHEGAVRRSLAVVTRLRER
jgi:diadenosine tetraphosphate (Ap4A) HIT family hydrolase